MKGFFLTFTTLTICFSSTNQARTKQTARRPPVVCPSERNVEVRMSWLSNQEHDSDPSKDAIVGQRLMLCDNDTLGPLVNDETLEKCKALPKNCKLDNGIIYYYNDQDECFIQLSTVEYPSGMNDIETPLGILTSAASDGYPLNSTVEIKEIKGLRVPNSTIPHNGCVRIDQYCDDCGLCNRIVWFVGFSGNVEQLPHYENFTVKEMNCDILKYD